MLKFDSGIYTEHTTDVIVLQSMLVLISSLYLFYIFLESYEFCSYNSFTLNYFTRYSYCGAAEQAIAHPCRIFYMYCRCIGDSCAVVRTEFQLLSCQAPLG